MLLLPPVIFNIFVKIMQCLELCGPHLLCLNVFGVEALALTTLMFGDVFYEMVLLLGDLILAPMMFALDVPLEQMESSRMMTSKSTSTIVWREPIIHFLRREPIIRLFLSRLVFSRREPIIRLFPLH